MRELLNGVDIERPRKRDELLTRTDRAVTRFISYAHKDEALRAELDAHLKLMQRTGLVQKWDDRLLKPGEDGARASTRICSVRTLSCYW